MIQEVILTVERSMSLNKKAAAKYLMMLKNKLRLVTEILTGQYQLHNALANRKMKHWNTFSLRAITPPRSAHKKIHFERTIATTNYLRKIFLSCITTFSKRIGRLTFSKR